MEKPEIKYYDYYKIGNMIGTDVRLLTNVLFKMNILKKGNDPEDIVLYRKNMVNPLYILQNRDQYDAFFKESFHKGNDGFVYYKLEVTDKFIEFVKTIIKENGRGCVNKDETSTHF